MERQGKAGQGRAIQKASTIAWRRLVCGLHELCVRVSMYVCIQPPSRSSSRPHRHLKRQMGGVRPVVRPSSLCLTNSLSFRSRAILSSFPNLIPSILTVQCLPSQTTKSKTSSPSRSRVHYSSPMLAACGQSVPRHALSSHMSVQQGSGLKETNLTTVIPPAPVQCCSQEQLLLPILQVPGRCCPSHH